jgi:hypothetical protein
MSVTNIPRLERFFRLAVSLDIDKDDLGRYDEFLNCKVHDLLLRAQATATANARDIIFPQDLPVTKGLQEQLQDFRKLDQQVGLKPVAMQRPYLRERYSEFRDNWITLTIYKRFEQLIALVITWLIAVIIAAAAWELTKEVLILIGKGLIDPLDYRAFQADLRRDHDRADRTRVQAFHRRCGRTPERHHPGRVRYCARA